MCSGILDVLKYRRAFWPWVLVEHTPKSVTSIPQSLTTRIMAACARDILFLSESEVPFNPTTVHQQLRNDTTPPNRCTKMQPPVRAHTHSSTSHRTSIPAHTHTTSLPPPRRPHLWDRYHITPPPAQPMILVKSAPSPHDHVASADPTFTHYALT